jgi:hypothetical protein
MTKQASLPPGLLIRTGKWVWTLATDGGPRWPPATRAATIRCLVFPYPYVNPRPTVPSLVYP